MSLSTRRINDGFLTANILGETLKKDFAANVIATRFIFVRLYGSVGYESICKVLKSKRGNANVVKIETEWIEFCLTNGYISGDVLNFRFVNKNRNNLIRVIKKAV
ncbi:hypothetical protein TSUD_299860 [Trifolium subterraneum]|uniref:Uncharacterized protein n=1 Tax=Trifolium subterraneum TaxID=3900 RepID=A0A2Z6NY40_TRISU|nr:hypothetical protein TSUD_299860 [Trifolium subterraneum]